MTTIIRNICYRVTRRCNWQCYFCQAPTNSKELTTSQHYQALTKLAIQGFRSLKITGGEPMLRHDLEQIMEHAANLKYNITLCSNGSLLRESALDLLIKFRGKIKISLHSMVGTSMMPKQLIELAQKGIVRAIDKGIHTSIHCIITSENRNELDEILAYAIQNGVSKLTLIPIVQRGMLAGKVLDTSMPWQKIKKIADEKQFQYPQIIIKYLDLYRKPYYVFETDGNLYMQVQTEAKDKLMKSIIES